MSLVRDWERIEGELPEGWGDARLALRIEDDAARNRAAALLGPLNPGRRGSELRFFTARRGAGFGPDHLRRLLRRLDAERIPGELVLLAAGDPTVETAVERPTLAAAWDALVETLPDDWSDLYGELGLTSTDHLERGALLLSPLNPARYGAPTGFRFRVARRHGYGASAAMARRCLERLDAAGIPGRVAAVNVLSDTRPVATQGPVWRVGGKSV